MSTGFGGTSPKSAQLTLSKGEIPVTGFIARIMVERSRIWRGPCRAPGLLVVPPSQGTPNSPIFVSSKRGWSGFIEGSLMKVGKPAKRASSIAETGWKNLSASYVIAIFDHFYYHSYNFKHNCLGVIRNPKERGATMFVTACS